MVDAGRLQRRRPLSRENGYGRLPESASIQRLGYFTQYATVSVFGMTNVK
jgi:hypothetical protein